QQHPSRARDEPLYPADDLAPPAAEDERPLRQIGGEREGLLLERLRLHDRRLRKGDVEPRGLGHRLSVFAPRLRHADETGVELATACVALVVGAERDGGERLAVRALGAEPAHATSFSNRTSSDT